MITPVGFDSFEDSLLATTKVYGELGNVLPCRPGARREPRLRGRPGPGRAWGRSEDARGAAGPQLG